MFEPFSQTIMVLFSNMQSCLPSNHPLFKGALVIKICLMMKCMLYELSGGSLKYKCVHYITFGFLLQSSCVIYAREVLRQKQIWRGI